MKNINYNNFNNKYTYLVNENEIIPQLRSIYIKTFNENIIENNNNIKNFTNKVNEIFNKDKQKKIPYYTIKIDNVNDIIFNSIKKFSKQDINELIYPKINNIDKLIEIHKNPNMNTNVFYNEHFYNFDNYIIELIKKKISKKYENLNKSDIYNINNNNNNNNNNKITITIIK